MDERERERERGGDSRPVAAHAWARKRIYAQKPHPSIDRSIRRSAPDENAF